MPGSPALISRRAPSPARLVLPAALALAQHVALPAAAQNAAPNAPATDGASDCILDHCAERRPINERRFDRGDPSGFEKGRPRPRGGSRPGEFDFYVLSLSWSPGFCATGGDEKGRDQCRVGADLGFTVHGLWPQYNHGFPSDCRGQTNPPREALVQTDGVYPDQRLARYEWRRHGTCSGLSPAEYFGAAKSARDAVTVPPRFKDAHAEQNVTPADVERAFIDANPQLRPGMVAAICRDNTLDEVRVCFAKDLKSFQVCPEVVRGRCHSANLSVPPIR